MIKSFKCKETEKLFDRKWENRIPREIQRVALRKLEYIKTATNVTDLRIPPGNHFEKLKGKRSGQYSIRINDQWRVCFNWKDGNAYNVEITDYH
jgi:proteic killer suppression protein